jgi:hypothetical protein
MHTGAICEEARVGENASLACLGTDLIGSVSFASFGAPTGTCGAYITSSCHASTSLDVVRVSVWRSVGLSVTLISFLFSLVTGQ